jgi:8-oxo-dGTP pyrophosphatase MutT (NUDIX family)
MEGRAEAAPPVVTMTGAEVRAAGGLLWRPSADGGTEVLLVHRPRYDDWSLPKGKCEPGESDEDCARREVREETGFRAELERELPEVRYRDHKDRPKVVRYWVMQPSDPGAPFVPNDEVDEIRWLPVREASDRLSYEHDRVLVANSGV